MKVTRVSLFRKEVPMLCGKFTCSVEPGVSCGEVIIIKVETDEGIIGYGEAGSAGGYPNYAHGTLASTAELIRRHLLGVDIDPTNLNAAQEKMRFMAGGNGSVKAAFDIACWDIASKSLDRPIHALLGGKLQDSLPLHRVIPIGSPDSMAKEVEAWRMEGYNTFLIKAGLGSIHQDIERIQAVLDKRLPGEEYTVDAAGRWRVDEALRVLKALKNYDFIIEQPCCTYEECLALRGRVDIPMKLDNAIHSVNDVLRAHADNACELMALKLDKLGGFTPVKLACDIIATAGMGVSLEAVWATEISAAAVIHLGMTIPPENFLTSTDLHNYSPLTVTTDDNIQVENGRMFFRDEVIGLGIDVNTEILGEPDIVLHS
ncbi:MAG: Mandelate racemase/muconate lactonizing enzyme family protein [uncultured Thiotrichaceae bacterium]|uniref:Mandelate racemase/muconate lactonizing enzyme family protein n=1 Tax=uncultured Thiotrichaceae bacterium TaxID=298394 RepID=A0A6S6UHZ2_9GAMM|nr:MAG: Mandelate racemase/muconate lactonizing enzyme family protein [uncultured Thiotrichaceae bacterium]